MLSPFDTKNRVAAVLDRLALRALLLTLCVGYFFWLWRSGVGSLLAGGALFVLAMLTWALLERRTLARRDRALRERVGGAIALEELLTMPGSAACETVCRLLCAVLGAQHEGGAQMRYGERRWLVRCAQCLPGSSASEGDVLSAHRARVESGAEQCVLASTGGFSPGAVRASEWLEPPVRLLTGRQLARLFGSRHPATDEEIARQARKHRTPFSWQRMRALALTPAKQRRYLLCAFLLTMLYLTLGALPCLVFGLLAFVLAMLCARENRQRFQL